MDDRRWIIRLPAPGRSGEWVTLEEVEENMAFYQIYEVNIPNFRYPRKVDAIKSTSSDLPLKISVNLALCLFFSECESTIGLLPLSVCVNLCLQVCVGARARAGVEVSLSSSIKQVCMLEWQISRPQAHACRARCT
jgi:hypothetical protein